MCLTIWWDLRLKGEHRFAHTLQKILVIVTQTGDNYLYNLNFFVYKKNLLILDLNQYSTWLHLSPNSSQFSHKPRWATACSHLTIKKAGQIDEIVRQRGIFSWQSELGKCSLSKFFLCFQGCTSVTLAGNGLRFGIFFFVMSEGFRIFAYKMDTWTDKGKNLRLKNLGSLETQLTWNFDNNQIYIA